MSGLLNEHASGSLATELLLEKMHRMTEALDMLWHFVEAGRVRVSSKALLRAAKNVSFPEIGRRLQDPCVDCRRVSRDLRLLINTFEYILKPEPQV